MTVRELTKDMNANTHVEIYYREDGYVGYEGTLVNDIYERWLDREVKKVKTVKVKCKCLDTWLGTRTVEVVRITV